MDKEENRKRSNSYYLDSDVIEWLERKGKEMERGSASYFLNKVARQAMEAERPKSTEEIYGELTKLPVEIVSYPVSNDVIRDRRK